MMYIKLWLNNINIAPIVFKIPIVRINIVRSKPSVSSITIFSFAPIHIKVYHKVNIAHISGIINRVHPLCKGPSTVWLIFSKVIKTINIYILRPFTNPSMTNTNSICRIDINGRTVHNNRSLVIKQLIINSYWIKRMIICKRF